MQIICLMGPTASGKTDLAIKIASHLPCEIISVDSSMVYRGMDIGTAKPSVEQLSLIKHHLIDICDPAEAYSAAQFRCDALKLIEQIFAQGKIPLLVGGTMLYFKVLLQGISALPSADPVIREKILADADKVGWEKMHAKLQTIDPQAAIRIASNDSQRIQRALEIYAISGKSMTELCELFPPEPLPYEVINLAIAPSDRVIIDDRIAKRFKVMLENGFIEEVEQLFKRGDLHVGLPSIRAVGYRQIWDYLAGKISFAQMQQLALIATHQLAKRQLTWLRTWQDILLFDSESSLLEQKIMQCIARNV